MDNDWYKEDSKKNGTADRIWGDDYQILVFWEYASKMLCKDSQIDSIGYEWGDVKSFDDVVVNYKIPQQFRTGCINRDYIQVKFHKLQSNLITIDNLLSAKFVGAHRYSFMDKVVMAYRNNREAFLKSRFILYTPWDIDMNDDLYRYIDNIDYNFDLDQIFRGQTDKSRDWQVRNKMKQALAIDDEQLREILGQICIYAGSRGFSILKDLLDARFLNIGLRVWPNSSITNPYIDIIRNCVKRRHTLFLKTDINELCKGEGLLEPYEHKTNLTIQSFGKAAEDMEESSRTYLCLLPYFEKRYLKNDESWEGIYQKIDCFIADSLKKDVNYGIELKAHLTIAFMTGRLLNPKTGLRVMPIQNTVNGSEYWPIGDSDNIELDKLDIFIEEDKESRTNDTALFISISNDIYEDVQEYIEQNHLQFCRKFICKMPNIGNNSLKNGYHAWKLTEQINELLEKRTPAEKRGELHIFAALPTSVIFNLGKLSLSYGKIQLYEFDFERLKTASYYPSAKFPMDGTF